MEDSLHLKTEPILIFVNDFLNVMARFGITSDEELFSFYVITVKRKWTVQVCLSNGGQTQEGHRR